MNTHANSKNAKTPMNAQSLRIKRRAEARWTAILCMVGALLAPRFALAQTQDGEEQKPSPDNKAETKDNAKELTAKPSPDKAAEGADNSKELAANSPRVHHAPPSVAPPHSDLAIEVTMDFPQMIRSAALIYRRVGGDLRAVSFQRGAGPAYVAVIPADDVIAPGIAYTIEIERTDGKRVSAFAARDKMHLVQVIEDRMDARERILYERLGKRRSVATATGEYVQFGKVSGQSALCPGGAETCNDNERRTPEVSEQYWKVEFSYTYRPLRTVAEFSIRGGVVRGTSLDSNSLDEEDYKVGLNYGAPSVRFRILDEWHVEGEFLTSITEQGFAVGAGLMTIIGDPYGSNITIGFESVGFSGESYFGTRFFSRMDIAASDVFIISPIIEISDMPRSEHFGVRLLGEFSYNIGGGFLAAVRAGYQAREAASGGVGLGGRVSFAF